MSGEIAAQNPTWNDNHSFLVIEDNKASVLNDLEKLKSAGAPLEVSQEDQYFQMIKDQKAVTRNEMQAACKALEKKATDEIGLVQIHQLFASISSLLEQALKYTSVAEQQEFIKTYKREANALEGVKSSLTKSIQNTYSEKMAKINAESIKSTNKGRKTPEQAQEVLREVHAIMTRISEEASAFSQFINEKSLEIDRLISISKKKTDELSQIEKCLAEVILPELIQKQQWAILSEGLFKDFTELSKSEGEVRGLFAKALKPSDDELLLPAVFTQLLQAPSILEHSEKLATWEAIAELGLSMPQQMERAYNTTPNACQSMKECSLAEAEIESIQALIAAQKEIAHQIKTKTEKITEEIKVQASKNRSYCENLNLEQAEIGELRTTLEQLMAQRQQQDILIKQKTKTIGDLEQESATLKEKSSKLIAHQDNELAKTLDDYTSSEKASYKKKAELQEVEVRLSELKTRKAAFLTIIESNAKKLDQKDQLEAQLSLLKDKLVYLQTKQT